MKLKLSDAVEVYTAVTAIKNANNLDIQTAWQLGDWEQEFKTPATRFNTQRDELAKKFGEANPDNKDEFIIQPDKKDEFLKEIEKLGDIEVEVKGQKKLSFELLKAAGVKVPPAATLKAMRVFVE